MFKKYYKEANDEIKPSEAFVSSVIEKAKKHRPPAKKRYLKYAVPFAAAIAIVSAAAVSMPLWQKIMDNGGVIVEEYSTAPMPLPDDAERTPVPIGSKKAKSASEDDLKKNAKERTPSPSADKASDKTGDKASDKTADKTSGAKNSTATPKASPSASSAAKSRQSAAGSSIIHPTPDAKSPSSSAKPAATAAPVKTTPPKETAKTQPAPAETASAAATAAPAETEDAAEKNTAQSSTAKEETAQIRAKSARSAQSISPAAGAAAAGSTAADNGAYYLQGEYDDDAMIAEDAEADTAESSFTDDAGIPTPNGYRCTNATRSGYTFENDSGAVIYVTITYGGEDIPPQYSSDGDNIRAVYASYGMRVNVDAYGAEMDAVEEIIEKFL